MYVLFLMGALVVIVWPIVMKRVGDTDQAVSLGARLDLDFFFRLCFSAF